MTHPYKHWQPHTLVLHLPSKMAHTLCVACFLPGWTFLHFTVTRSWVPACAKPSTHIRRPSQGLGCDLGTWPSSWARLSFLQHSGPLFYVCSVFQYDGDKYRTGWAITYLARANIWWVHSFRGRSFENLSIAFITPHSRARLSNRNTLWSIYIYFF